MRLANKLAPLLLDFHPSREGGTYALEWISHSMPVERVGVSQSLLLREASEGLAPTLSTCERVPRGNWPSSSSSPDLDEPDRCSLRHQAPKQPAYSRDLPPYGERPLFLAVLRSATGRAKSDVREDTCGYSDLRRRRARRRPSTGRNRLAR